MMNPIFLVFVHKKDPQMRAYVIYWQGWQELNPRLWFWRPSYYHCTTPLNFDCLNILTYLMQSFNKKINFSDFFQRKLYPLHRLMTQCSTTISTNSSLAFVELVHSV